jgi:hypothetical protein
MSFSTKPLSRKVFLNSCHVISLLFSVGTNSLYIRYATKPLMRNCERSKLNPDMPGKSSSAFFFFPSFFLLPGPGSSDVCCLGSSCFVLCVFAASSTVCLAICVVSLQKVAALAGDMPSLAVSSIVLLSSSGIPSFLILSRNLSTSFAIEAGMPFFTKLNISSSCSASSFESFDLPSFSGFLGPPGGCEPDMGELLL